MRKSTLFISAALTTFMLAVMFGVASAYQNIVKATTQPLAAQTQPAVVEVVNAPQPTQVQATTITPDAAGALASKVINRTDLFSAELTQLNGVDVYLVTFSSGDLVYVSLDGQILSISKLPVTTIVQKSSNRGGSSNTSSGGTRPAGGESEHEGGDD